MASGVIAPESGCPVRANAGDDERRDFTMQAQAARSKPLPEMNQPSRHGVTACLVGCEAGVVVEQGI